VAFLGICAGLLVVAAAAQALRIGRRTGDWMPLCLGLAFVAVLVALSLLAVLVGPHVD
jgi:hypothetical protein